VCGQWMKQRSSCFFFLCEDNNYIIIIGTIIEALKKLWRWNNEDIPAKRLVFPFLNSSACLLMCIAIAIVVGCSWLFTLIICNAKRAFIDGLECDWLHALRVFFLCIFWVKRKRLSIFFCVLLNIFEYF